jgi:hypothetical protein
MTAAKALFTVTAGVIPGTLEDEYTRQWCYTARMAEADRALGPEPATTNRFTEMLKEVHQYAMEISDPARVNWVKTEFIWI